MARFSSTEKWGDGWFTELSPIGKLTFLYLVDKCDNAGFYEINKKIDPIILGVTIEQYFKALEEISKSYIKSKDGKKIWLKNYLRHQKNLPINPNNNAHKQIISILQANIYFFDYDFDYLGGANKPLIRGLGNVIGNVIGNKEGGMGETKMESSLWTNVVKDFKNDFRWVEKFCRDKSVSKSNMESRMLLFVTDCELAEDYKGLSELKNHFLHWHNKKSKNGGFESHTPVRQLSDYEISVQEARQKAANYKG